MNRYKLSIGVLLLALLSSCVTGGGTKTRIDSLPMYGQPEVERPEELKQADKDFIKKAQALPLNNIDLTAVRNDISNLLHDRSHDDGSYAPLLIRFARHNSGTYDKNNVFNSKKYKFNVSFGLENVPNCYFGQTRE